MSATLKSSTSTSTSSTSTSSSTDTNLSTINIQKLFDYKRIQNQMDLIPIIIYFPFGVCFFLIRVFIGFHAFLIASLLPKASSVRCFILRTMCVILGIVVKEEDVSIKTKSATKVIISNHVTNFDHLAVDLVLPCIVPGVWDLPKILNWLLGFHDFGVKQGREILIENVRSHLNSCESPIPILAHPEGATTNGRMGLLKFSSWPFHLEVTLQPIYISVTRPPPIKITPSVLGSRWWSDLFWLLFVPFTIFSIKYLPSVKRNENESADDFAKRVQTSMANMMRINATNFTDSDKIELAKRIFHVPPQPQTHSSASNYQRLRVTNVPTTTSSSSSVRISSQLEQMATKVKEVLPQVPLNAIQRDLMVTTNIDETITRILEGTVEYVPEQVPAEKMRNKEPHLKSAGTQEANNSTTCSTTDSLPTLNTGAKTFGKDANERTKSFKERKAALIENARIRYIQKFGLQSNETQSD